jgi:hypothetical protein
LGGGTDDVNGPGGLIRAGEQAAGSAAVLGVVFEEAGVRDALKEMVQEDCLLGHFLLGALSDADLLGGGLGADGAEEEQRIILGWLGHGVAYSTILISSGVRE